MTLHPKLLLFFNTVSTILGWIIKGLVAAVIVAVFLLIVSFSAVAMDIIYLWNIHGKATTTEMIDAYLPTFFIISMTIWLVILVIYKKYFA